MTLTRNKYQMTNEEYVTFNELMGRVYLNTGKYDLAIESISTSLDEKKKKEVKSDAD